MRETGLPGAWLPKIGIPGGGIAYRSRRWHLFKAATAWGALGAAILAVTVHHLAGEGGFLLIVPLEFAGVYTAALLANLTLRRWEEKRMHSPSIIDQQELLKEEMEENLANLRFVKGWSTEQLAKEQLRIIHEYRRRRSSLLHQANRPARNPPVSGERQADARRPSSAERGRGGERVRRGSRVSRTKGLTQRHRDTERGLGG